MSYQINKIHILNYFTTENGKEKLLNAQKKYFQSEKGKIQNQSNRMKSYYKTKPYFEQVKQFRQIEIEF